MRPFKDGVDFREYRVVVSNIVLTSGSIRLRDVAVHRHESKYIVYYDLKSPKIGTHDIRIAQVYALLPKGDEEVEACRARLGDRAGTVVDVQTGGF